MQYERIVLNQTASGAIPAPGARLMKPTAGRALVGPPARRRFFGMTMATHAAITRDFSRPDQALTPSLVFNHSSQSGGAR